MTDLQIRLARLDDTAAITHLSRRKIEVWQRINAQGQVENLPYDALTVYERWTHGGPWMSIETAAIYLSHLLRVGCLPLVAVDGETVIGYVEVYPGEEPSPYGKHLHMRSGIISDTQNVQIQNRLLQHLVAYAQQHAYHMLTIGFSAFDQTSFRYFQENNFTTLQKIMRYTLSAQTGQGFYKAIDHHDATHTQVAGWNMPVGRLENARYHWETLWPSLWNGVPEFGNRRIQHLHLTASGQPAFACFQQHQFDARSAHVYLWSPRTLTAQMLTAIRDWSHRQSYRTLIMDIPEETAKSLGPEAEHTPQQQVILGLNIQA